MVAIEENISRLEERRDKLKQEQVTIEKQKYGFWMTLKFGIILLL